MARFTLVRHSAYAVGGNAAFDDAVEVCELGDQQMYAVQTAGGLIFETRVEAAGAQNDVNNPPGAASGGASGDGHFSSLRIAGAEIYVPHPATREQ
jgi:hypothetical protein